MYPIELVKPMENELLSSGFEPLTDEQEVTQALSDKSGTVLLMVNSVCGCAAAHARPGVRLALLSDKTPDKLYTVFAGVDREATAKAREFLAPYPPSSPSIALFKNGELVHMIERYQIEGRSADIVAANLKMAFASYC